MRKSKKRKSSLENVLFGILETFYPLREEIGACLVIIVSLLTVLGLLNLTGGGIIPSALGRIAGVLLGWAAIPVVLAVIVSAATLVVSQVKEIPYHPLSGIGLAGFGIFLVSMPAVIQILTIANTGTDSLILAQNHDGGGYVGWLILSLSVELMGEWPAWLLFAVLSAGGGWLMVADAHAVYRAAQKPLSQAPVAPQKLPVAKVDPPAAAFIERAGLPPIGVLDTPPALAGADGNADAQAKIIEDTLRSFGVPAEVVEINRGPTVTQFGVKPGVTTRRERDGTITEQRIRVSKIEALGDDLALALAASPIRIETPVPGRPIVGIEVPGGNIPVVSLRAGIESDDFRRAGEMRIALGQGVGGAFIVADMAAQPHLLIAGSTGSGKSVCINAIIVNLLMTHSPETLRLLMVDPKMVELTSYNGIPHLVAPVITDYDQVSGALAWVTREMERRYKEFAAIGVRNIAGYNKKVEKDRQIPFLVVIIDELADLMMLAADEIERHICRIAQMARATGIHMIIATQRPSTDVVTGLIKANFPARIAFAVSSQIDSRVILDTPGAEKLLGKGDMLYVAPDSPRQARLQGCYVSDAEINKVVQYWQAYQAAPATAGIEAADSPDKSPGSLDKAKPARPGIKAETPWAGIQAEEAAKDDMLAKAIALVRAAPTGVSTSFLQRKLGIGYPRAARLIDQLEEQGIIGPSAGGNTGREVLGLGGQSVE